MINCEGHIHNGFYSLPGCLLGWICSSSASGRRSINMVHFIIYQSERGFLHFGWHLFSALFLFTGSTGRVVQHTYAILLIFRCIFLSSSPAMYIHTEFGPRDPHSRAKHSCWAECFIKYLFLETRSLLPTSAFNFRFKMYGDLFISVNHTCKSRCNGQCQSYSKLPVCWSLQWALSWRFRRNESKQWRGWVRDGWEELFLPFIIQCWRSCAVSLWALWDL